MKEWSLKKLGEVSEFTNGGAWKPEEYVEYGIPVVRVSDIQNETISLEQCKYLSLESVSKYRKHTLFEGDLVIATVGSHPTQPGSVVGRPGIVSRYVQGALLNQNAVRITPINSSLDKKYLGYLGKSQFFRNYIIQCARGAANQVRMSIGLLKEMEVLLPSLSTQRKIAAVLSNYDRLIENNTRRIEILEEMARSLYDEWFVKFRFPGYEQTKMVDSELGVIPEGWEFKSIGEVIETIGGGTPSTKEKEYWHNGDILWYTPSDLTSTNSMFIAESEKKITALGLKKSSARMFPPYSVMMTSRATIGVVALNNKEACTNQGFITCIPSNKLPAYQIYFWILNNKDKIISLASGATFKEINKTTFRSLPIIIVADNTRESFIQIINPVCNQIENLQTKNNNLRRTRDLLLPKLISGEIDVENLDIETEVIAA